MIHHLGNQVAVPVEAKIRRVHQLVAGAAFPGLITAVIDSGAAPYNSFYEVKALDGSLMPPIVAPRFVVPHFRPFNTDFVDMESALEKDFVSILAMGPIPLTQPDPPEGCCLDLINGSVEFVDGAACGGIDQFFFGDGMPCAIFDIAEDVKISLCPEQPASAVGPPPRVFANPGLLT